MQFDKVFWNSDFGDYSGFDVVYEYVRKGRHGCSEVADFLKARAQIEETYAKQLATLAKSQSADKMSGSIGKGWGSVINSVQQESASHQKLADVFNEQYQLTSQLTKTLKQKAREKEEEVRQCQNLCRLLYEKALKSKAQFSKRADQKSLLEEERNRLKRESHPAIVTGKDLQKLDASIKKAVTAADTSKQQCSKTLERLAVARQLWEAKTSHALLKFHEMEKTRITYLRGLFWKIMNAICQNCVEVDKCCDETRNVLLTCDPDNDLDDFISSRRTGDEKPGEITFENLGKTANSNGTQSSKSFKMSISKKLASPWKSSNGHAAADTSHQKKHLLERKKSKEKIKEAKMCQDDPSCSSDGCSAPASPSPTGSPGKGIGISEKCKYVSSLKTTYEDEQEATRYCIVNRTWYDNQGVVLAEGGVTAKLLEKSSDTLWLIELDDQQTLYCPTEHLEELPVGHFN